MGRRIYPRDGVACNLFAIHNFHPVPANCSRTRRRSGSGCRHCQQPCVQSPWAMRRWSCRFRRVWY